MIGTRLEFGHDTKVRAEEARAKFRNQLFTGALAAILCVAAENAINAMRSRSPMHAFMRERVGISLGVTKTFEQRHLDDVERWCEESLVTAMPDGRAGVGEEGVHMRDALRRRDGQRWSPVIVIRQVVDL